MRTCFASCEVPGTGQCSSLVCMLFAEAVVYGHSMLGFCKRLSTASLNHPPFTFYNARGLRIVKCPLRMKRTSSFVCDCVLEEQSLSVLSLSAKTRQSVLGDVRRMRRVFVRMCFIDVDCSGNRFVCVFDSLCSVNRFVWFRFVECFIDSDRAFDSLCCGNR